MAGGKKLSVVGVIPDLGDDDSDTEDEEERDLIARAMGTDPDYIIPSDPLPAQTPPRSASPAPAPEPVATREPTRGATPRQTEPETEHERERVPPSQNFQRDTDTKASPPLTTSTKRATNEGPLHLPRNARPLVSPVRTVSVKPSASPSSAREGSFVTSSRAGSMARTAPPAFNPRTHMSPNQGHDSAVRASRGATTSAPAPGAPRPPSLENVRVAPWGGRAYGGGGGGGGAGSRAAESMKPGVSMSGAAIPSALSRYRDQMKRRAPPAPSSAEYRDPPAMTLDDQLKMYRDHQRQKRTYPDKAAQYNGETNPHTGGAQARPGMTLEQELAEQWRTLDQARAEESFGIAGNAQYGANPYPRLTQMPNFAAMNDAERAYTRIRYQIALTKYARSHPTIHITDDQIRNADDMTLHALLTAFTDTQRVRHKVDTYKFWYSVSVIMVEIILAKLLGFRSAVGFADSQIKLIAKGSYDSLLGELSEKHSFTATVSSSVPVEIRVIMALGINALVYVVLYFVAVKIVPVESMREKLLEETFPKVLNLFSSYYKAEGPAANEGIGSAAPSVPAEDFAGANVVNGLYELSNSFSSLLSLGKGAASSGGGGATGGSSGATSSAGRRRAAKPKVDR